MNERAKELVETLKAQDDLHDPVVEEAFLRVPRHVFLPDCTPEEAYANIAVPLKRDAYGTVVSSASQPAMIAQMLEQLDLQRGHNVLEIGTASGYNAALMQYIVGDEGRVTTMELDTDLAAMAELSLQRALMSRIVVVHGDGAQGYAPRASYDRIIATVGVWDIPPAWIRQLRPNGKLVAPIWLDAFQVSAAFRHDPSGRGLYSEHNLPCWFVRLRGRDAGPGLTVRVIGSSLELVSSAAEQIDDAAVHALLSDDAAINHLDMPLTFDQTLSGLLPYLALNTNPDVILTSYYVPDGSKSYGLHGAGFGLLMRGSACFLPFSERGACHCFGSADAFIVLQDTLAAWRAASTPLLDKLRVRVLPIEGSIPEISAGRILTRRHHHIHMWMET